MTEGAMTPKTSGCSKRPGFSPAQPRRAETRRSADKAAGESKPEAYPLGYVEDFDKPRTTLADFFSILLYRGLENGLHQFQNAALHIGIVRDRTGNRHVAGSVGRHALPNECPGIDQ